jgi:hypothetical protein
MYSYGCISLYMARCIHMGMSNEQNDAGETIIFDIGLEVKQTNGEIVNWEQIRTQIEGECREYISLCSHENGV